MFRRRYGKYGRNYAAEANAVVEALARTFDLEVKAMNSPIVSPGGDYCGVAGFLREFVAVHHDSKKDSSIMRRKRITAARRLARNPLAVPSSTTLKSLSWTPRVPATVSVTDLQHQTSAGEFQEKEEHSPREHNNVITAKNVKGNFSSAVQNLGEFNSKMPLVYFVWADISGMHLPFKAVLMMAVKHVNHYLMNVRPSADTGPTAVAVSLGKQQPKWSSALPKFTQASGDVQSSSKRKKLEMLAKKLGSTNRVGKAFLEFDHVSENPKSCGLLCVFSQVAGQHSAFNIL